MVSLRFTQRHAGCSGEALQALEGLRIQRQRTRREPAFDFEFQRPYRSELIINPGDTLTTTCTYDNASDKRVNFGERTEDEMCFNFVTVWPAPGLFNSGGKASGRCIDR